MKQTDISERMKRIFPSDNRQSNSTLVKGELDQVHAHDQLLPRRSFAEWEQLNEHLLLEGKIGGEYIVLPSMNHYVFNRDPELINQQPSFRQMMDLIQVNSNYKKKSVSDVELILKQHELYLLRFYQVTHHEREPHLYYSDRQVHVQILKQLYGASIEQTYFKHKFLDMHVLEACDLPCHLLHLNQELVEQEERYALQTVKNDYTGMLTNKLISAYNFKESLDYHINWVAYPLLKNSYSQDKKSEGKDYLKYKSCKDTHAAVAMKIGVAQQVIDWYNKAISLPDRNTVHFVIDRLFDLALKFEMDESINEEADLELMALFSSHTQLFLESHLSFLLKVLKLLPYDASHSPGAFLDYVCNYPNFDNSYKAVILKTGLYLLNPYARITFYIFLNSLFYTWETVTKLRRPIVTHSNNLIYRDVPSYQSGIFEEYNDVKKVAAITFRDEDWNTFAGNKKSFKTYTTYVPLKTEYEDVQQFWYGVLTSPHRTYFKIAPTKLIKAFYQACENPEILGRLIQQFVRIPLYIKSGVDLEERPREMVLSADKTIQLHYFKKKAYTDDWIDPNQFTHDKVFLFQDGAKRPVRFGSVFQPECNRFSFLYRFYIFSTSTGADHLFYFRSTFAEEKEGPQFKNQPYKPIRLSIYEYHPARQAQLFTRRDTPGIMHWYLSLAYQRLDKMRLSSATPESDLKIMSSYWWHYHEGQDSIVVCLEIQQRLLYDSVKAKLLARIEKMKKSYEDHLAIKLAAKALTKAEHDLAQSHMLEVYKILMQGFDPVNSPEDNKEEPQFEKMWWLRQQYLPESKVTEALQEKQMFPDVMLRLMLLQELFGFYKETNQWHMLDFDFDYEPVDDFDQQLLQPIPKSDQRHFSPLKLEKLLQKKAWPQQQPQMQNIDTGQSSLPTGASTNVKADIHSKVFERLRTGRCTDQRLISNTDVYEITLSTASDQVKQQINEYLTEQEVSRNPNEWSMGSSLSLSLDSMSQKQLIAQKRLFAQYQSSNRIAHEANANQSLDQEIQPAFKPMPKIDGDSTVDYYKLARQQVDKITKQQQLQEEQKLLQEDLDKQLKEVGWDVQNSPVQDYLDPEEQAATWLLECINLVEGTSELHQKLQKAIDDQIYQQQFEKMIAVNNIDFNVNEDRPLLYFYAYYQAACGNDFYLLLGNQSPSQLGGVQDALLRGYNNIGFLAPRVGGTFEQVHGLLKKEITADKPDHQLALQSKEFRLFETQAQTHHESETHHSYQPAPKYPVFEELPAPLLFPVPSNQLMLYTGFTQPLFNFGINPNTALVQQNGNHDATNANQTVQTLVTEPIPTEPVQTTEVPKETAQPSDDGKSGVAKDQEEPDKN